MKMLCVIAAFLALMGPYRAHAAPTATRTPTPRASATATPRATATATATASPTATPTLSELSANIPVVLDSTGQRCRIGNNIQFANKLDAVALGTSGVITGTDKYGWIMVTFQDRSTILVNGAMSKVFFRVKP